MCRENPKKYPSLAKNPPKYNTAYIVQKSNCRWHGEPTCLSLSSPEVWLLTICFADFKRAGQKVEGYLLFVPLRRFYDVIFVPLFCRPREKCGTMWKTTWRHNVDNIRQKDIKKLLAKTWRKYALFSLLLMFIKILLLITFFGAFFTTFSTDSKSVWNSAFFDMCIDFLKKKFVGHITTFWKLWGQTRKKRLKNQKTFLVNVSYSHQRVCIFHFLKKKSNSLYPTVYLKSLKISRHLTTDRESSAAQQIRYLTTEIAGVADLYR